MFVVLGRLSSYDDYILLANSFNTSRIVKPVRGSYSISPFHILSTSVVHTIHHNLCYYAIHIIRSSLEHRHTMVLAPVTYTLLIVQFYMHTDIKSLSCYLNLLLRC